METRFGTLKQVNPRNIWPNEAADFTPWLKDNIVYLSEALGMDLEIDDRESPVGSFSVDLVGKELGSSRLVVIENQLEQTDHSHLGQLFTYAAGKEAKIIVWISPQFRDEHREVMDWLNENTPEDMAFFGVQLEVIRIDNSLPTPLFKLVSQPNEWQKQVRAQVTSPRGEAYRSFWNMFLSKLKSKDSSATKSTKTQPDSYFTIGAGRTGFAYVCTFTTAKQICVQVYIDTGDREKNKKAYDLLADMRMELEEKVGAPMLWERLDDKKSSRISLCTEGTIDDSQEDLEVLADWAVASTLKMRKAFSSKIKALLIDDI